MPGNTHEVKIGGGRVAVLKEFLTAREARPIEAIAADPLLTEPSGRLKAEGLLKAQDESMKAVVVSLDGDSDNILERLLDLPKKDYDIIRNEVTKVISGESLDKKKEQE